MFLTRNSGSLLFQIIMWLKLVSTLHDFKFSLYFALLVRLFLPTIYQTFRVYILGSLPNAGQLDIASQLTWIQVIIDVIEKVVLCPLYFCLGKTLNDPKMTKTKVKTGLIISAIIYSIFSLIISGFAKPLIQLMSQNETLIEHTIAYIRIELIGVVFNSLSKILMVVFVMLQWNSMLYLTLFIQMITTSGFDYGLAIGAKLEVMGIAYSSVCSSLILFLSCLCITLRKLSFTMKGNIIFSKLHIRRLI